MPSQERASLSAYRLEKAKRRLATAQINKEAGDTASAVNRLYYATHSAMRAVFALEGRDFSKHTGILSHFAQDFISTGVFPKEMSRTMYDLFALRQDCDYDDFVEIGVEQYEKLEAATQDFIGHIETYLKDKL